jgi:membrane protease YdiL (CAAX protease family)
MNKRTLPLVFLLILAFLFWFELFYLNLFNFWIGFIIAAVILSGFSLYFNNIDGEAINYRLFYFEPKYLIIGILSAAILYTIFYAGNFILGNFIPQSNENISKVYDTKTLLNPILISLILIFIIAPAEEIFWRGFVQDILEEKFGDFKGWLLTSLLYGIIHITSLNFVLVIAALVCGFFWGWLFMKYKSLWISIISHSVFDIVIFILLPLK